MPKRNDGEIHVAVLSVGANREGYLEAISRGDIPDSVLRGVNFLREEKGLSVEIVSSQEEIRRLIPEFVRRFLPVSIQQLALLRRLSRFDIVIASDAPLLGYVVLMVSKTKWIHVAINTSVILRRHVQHHLRRMFLRRFLRLCTKIVVLSEQQGKDLRAFGVPTELIQEIRFGIDASYFSTIPRREGDCVLSVGRDLGRDYKTLFAAAQHIPHPVVIVAAGKNLSKEVVVPNNVQVIYDVPLEKLGALYQRARVGVILSQGDESIAGSDCCGQTVLLELMASGKPVIMTDSAWSREYFQDIEHIAVPVGGVQELVQEINSLWDNPEQYERLARVGTAVVQENYTTKSFAAGLRVLIADANRQAR